MAWVTGTNLGVRNCVRRWQGRNVLLLSVSICPKPHRKNVSRVSVLRWIRVWRPIWLCGRLPVVWIAWPRLVWKVVPWVLIFPDSWKTSREGSSCRLLPCWNVRVLYPQFAVGFVLRKNNVNPSVFICKNWRNRRLLSVIWNVLHRISRENPGILPCRKWPMPMELKLPLSVPDLPGYRVRVTWQNWVTMWPCSRRCMKSAVYWNMVFLNSVCRIAW